MPQSKAKFSRKDDPVAPTSLWSAVKHVHIEFSNMKIEGLALHRPRLLVQGTLSLSHHEIDNYQMTYLGFAKLPFVPPSSLTMAPGICSSI